MSVSYQLIFNEAPTVNAGNEEEGVSAIVSKPFVLVNTGDQPFPEGLVLAPLPNESDDLKMFLCEPIHVPPLQPMQGLGGAVEAKIPNAPGHYHTKYHLVNVHAHALIEGEPIVFDTEVACEVEPEAELPCVELIDTDGDRIKLLRNEDGTISEFVNGQLEIKEVTQFMIRPGGRCFDGEGEFTPVDMGKIQEIDAFMKDSGRNKKVETPQGIFEPWKTQEDKKPKEFGAELQGLDFTTGLATLQLNGEEHVNCPFSTPEPGIAVVHLAEGFEVAIQFCAPEPEKEEEDTPGASSSSASAPAPAPPAPRSAKVLECSVFQALPEHGFLLPLTEGEEVEGLKLVAAATPKDVPEGFPFTAGYGIGEFACTKPSTLLCKLLLQNDGPEAWPADSELRHCAGPGLGFSNMPLAEIPKGEKFEVAFELSLKPEANGDSYWALASGAEAFGLLLSAKTQ